jgi:hypothetical protein
MFDALANEFDGTAAALANEADIAALWHYEYTNQNVAIQGYWRLLYKMILRANLVIEKAAAYTTAKGDNAIVKQSMGEAYFLRGYAYTQLAFYWGGVPIRVKFTDPGNEDLVRSSADEVWAVAEADFKMAQSLLPASYDDANLGRATSGAATGFLGKLYLYTKKYTEADTEFAKITGYGLLPKAQWLDNFGQTNENNNSSLFEVQFKFNQGDGVCLMML